MPITSKTLFVGVICCSTLLSACGKKGPLYLPEAPKNQISSAFPHINNIEKSALRILSTEPSSQQEKS